MSLFHKLFDRSREHVTIHAENGQLVFKSEAVEVREQPLIRFADDGKIFAIGDIAATAPGGRLVRLFEPEAKGDDTAIRGFCRYLLALTTGLKLLQPRVTLIEPTLRRNFGRQATADLQRALHACGVHADIAEES